MLKTSLIRSYAIDFRLDPWIQLNLIANGSKQVHLERANRSRYTKQIFIGTDPAFLV